MNDEIKAKIYELRSNGLGYKRIAKQLALNQSTVKAFLHKLGETPGGICPVCGKALNSIPHKKRKKYCSDKCRMKWWAMHREGRSNGPIFHYTCPTCGKPFTAYGNAHRTYCSRACFQLGRRIISND